MIPISSNAAHLQSRALRLGSRALPLVYGEVLLTGRVRWPIWPVVVVGVVVGMVWLWCR